MVEQPSTSKKGKVPIKSYTSPSFKIIRKEREERNYDIKEKSVFHIVGISKNLKKIQTFLIYIPQKWEKKWSKFLYAKRLVNSDYYSPKVETGYDFIMDKKTWIEMCKYIAFTLTLTW